MNRRFLYNFQINKINLTDCIFNEADIAVKYVENCILYFVLPIQFKNQTF